MPLHFTTIHIQRINLKDKSPKMNDKFSFKIEMR
jgi:hypothetical protein